jgi:hypothetical protein
MAGRRHIPRCTTEVGQRVKYFYDTEFHEDGTTIDLISIGIVAEDGREYYAISSEFDYERALEHPWLPDNVLVHLPYSAERGGLDLMHPDVKSRCIIRREVTEFLHSTNPQLWAYYSAYDHVAYAQLFGTMMGIPKGLPKRTKDLACLIDTHEAWGFIPGKIGTEHNALDDARWVKLCYDFLMNRRA